MTDESQPSPPRASPFRGGFRFLPDEDRITVDVWGSDLTEILPRAAEAVFRAAGTPRSLVPAPAFRVEVRGDSAAELVTSLVTALIEMLCDQGRYATTAVCRSVVEVQSGGTLPAGVACVLLCEGGHVDSSHDSGLVRVHLPLEAAGVWEEGGILRARFQMSVEAR